MEVKTKMDEVICNDCGWFGERDALVAYVPGGDEEYCPECGSGEIVEAPVAGRV